MRPPSEKFIEVYKHTCWYTHIHTDAHTHIYMSTFLLLLIGMVCISLFYHYSVFKLKHFVKLLFKGLFHNNSEEVTSLCLHVSGPACGYVLYSCFVITLSPPQFSWQSNGLPEVIYRLLDCAPLPNMLHTRHNWWTLEIVGEQHERNHHSAPLKGGSGIYISTKTFTVQYFYIMGLCLLFA